MDFEQFEKERKNGTMVLEKKPRKKRTHDGHMGASEDSFNHAHSSFVDPIYDERDNYWVNGCNWKRRQGPMHIRDLM